MVRPGSGPNPDLTAGQTCEILRVRDRLAGIARTMPYVARYDEMDKEISAEPPTAEPHARRS